MKYKHFNYFRYPDFNASEEAAALENLLKAYDEGDEDAARATLSLPLIRYMDNAVCIPPDRWIMRYVYHQIDG